MRVRRYGILLAVLLVSLLLLTVQTRGGGTGRAGELVTVAVTPVQSLLVRIHRGALGFWANYVDWKSVRRENAALREENEHLRVQALQAGETREENARLRRLLVLRDRLPLATVAGEVIGREAGGWVRSLTVNRGRGDGIAQQTPVIVPDGLVGRVVQVHRGAAVDPAPQRSGLHGGRGGAAHPHRGAGGGRRGRHGALQVHGPRRGERRAAATWW